MAVFISQSTKPRSPERSLNGMGLPASLGQFAVKLLHFRKAVALDKNRYCVALRQSIAAHHICTHQHHVIAFEGGKEYKTFHCLWKLLGVGLPAWGLPAWGRLTYRLQEQLPTEALLVESHRLPAVAIEGEVSKQLGHWQRIEHDKGSGTQAGWRGAKTAV